MSDKFLSRLMYFAYRTTGTQRAMAVNDKGDVVASENLTEQVKDPEFSGFKNIEQAYAAGEVPHITNNMILDPDLAPNTNTNFANLHLVVVFPFEGIGAVYIDQHVRKGVVSTQVVERIMRMATELVESGRLNVSEDEMATLYEETV